MEPEISAHFENIQSVIIHNINTAEKKIVAAVAWFTDREIFQALRQQAANGISVKLVLTDDDINRPPKAPSFAPLTSLGCSVYFVKPGSKKESLMHHKFCVIDDNTVITGSYNWTNNARTNSENITVVRNNTEYTRRFLEAFELIIKPSEVETPSLDSGRIRKRIELIRSLIQLGESEDISVHSTKLKSASKTAGIEHILNYLDKGDFESAFESINTWLITTSALVTSEDADVPRLKLELLALEYELAAFNAERADIERRIYGFNRKHDDALGEIISKVLELQARLKRKIAEKEKYENSAVAEEAEYEAKEAEENYQYFSDEHEAIQESPNPFTLDKEEEKLLKRLFKQASLECHPDRVPDEIKEQAKVIFQEVEALYRAQDLNKLQGVFERIKSGRWNIESYSSGLKQSDKISAKIAEIKNLILETINALRELRASEVVKLMERLEQESAWEVYLLQRRSAFNQQLESIQEKLNGMDDQLT